MSSVCLANLPYPPRTTWSPSTDSISPTRPFPTTPPTSNTTSTYHHTLLSQPTPSSGLQEVGLSWKGELFQLFDDSDYRVIDTHYGREFNDHMGIVLAYPAYLYRCDAMRCERLAEVFADPFAGDEEPATSPGPGGAKTGGGEKVSSPDQVSTASGSASETRGVVVGSSPAAASVGGGEPSRSGKIGAAPGFGSPTLPKGEKGALRADTEPGGKIAEKKSDEKKPESWFKIPDDVKVGDYLERIVFEGPSFRRVQNAVKTNS